MKSPAVLVFTPPASSVLATDAWAAATALAVDVALAVRMLVLALVTKAVGSTPDSRATTSSVSGVTLAVTLVAAPAGATECRRSALSLLVALGTQGKAPPMITTL